jgi:hypothetical protein
MDMPVFTIEALPALYGDCLWIEYGQTEERIHRVLIDGGLKGTFEHIQRKVLQIDGPRTFDLLVVTHVDEDHIAGAVRLLGALRTLGVEFDDIWFNGRAHLEGSQVSLDALGSKQGEFLGALIAKQAAAWNTAFKGGPIEVPPRGELPVRKLAGGMKLTLLSPGRTQLEDMIKVWDAELRAKKDVDWTDVDAVMDALDGSQLGPPVDALVESKPDDSEANGTSIALLAEFAGRTVLLGADAFAPVLSESIDRLPHGAQKLQVDLFKVPHHGSGGNLTVELLERLDCGHYLVSTNGTKYGHPYREAMARIVRHGGHKPTMHFNYRSTHSEFWDDARLGQGDTYAAAYPSDGTDGCLIDVMALRP